MVSAVDELVYNVKLDNNLKVHQKSIVHKGPDVHPYTELCFLKVLTFSIKSLNCLLAFNLQFTYSNFHKRVSLKGRFL